MSRELVKFNRLLSKISDFIEYTSETDPEMLEDYYGELVGLVNSWGMDEDDEVDD